MVKLHVNEKYCKGCGICIAFCPSKAIRKSPKLNARGYFPPEGDDLGRCNQCGLCSLLCPDFAILVSDGIQGEM